MGKSANYFKFASEVPEFTGRFQIARLRTYFPDRLAKELSLPYVEAHLFALKPGYEPMGAVQI